MHTKAEEETERTNSLKLSGSEFFWGVIFRCLRLFWFKLTETWQPWLMILAFNLVELSFTLCRY